jgi:hypothetical protein
MKAGEDGKNPELKHCLPNLDTGAKRTGAIVETTEEQLLSGE